MTKPLLLSNPEEFYISTSDIQTRVAEIGEELAERFDGQEVTLLTVLRGAKPFAQDLKREMQHSIFNAKIVSDSIRVKSYEGTESTGDLRFLKKPETDLHGKNILVAEDILDTGQTLSLLVRWLHSEYSPASLTVVTMLEKPGSRLPSTDIDAEVITGLRIADKFVVGYGLDYNEEYRELPFITICEQQPDGLWTPKIPDGFALAA